MKWMKGMLVMNLMKMIKVDENDEVNEGENEGGKKPMRLIKHVLETLSRQKGVRKKKIDKGGKHPGEKNDKKNNVDENENDADKYHGHGEYDDTPKEMMKMTTLNMTKAQKTMKLMHITKVIHFIHSFASCTVTHGQGKPMAILTWRQKTKCANFRAPLRGVTE